MSGTNIPKPSKRPKTPDKITEQLRQDASAYSQGFADGYRLAKKALITCKDCKYYQHKCCVAWGDGSVAVASETDEDGYCHLAERREE